MVKIAVCDDQEMELKLLELHLEQYRQLRGCGDMESDWFSSSAELIKCLEEGRRYDLFILDMMMPEYNGVDVGRAVRAAGQKSAIIYITASADFALDAISVHPEQYLLKPLDPEALYRALDAVLERLGERPERPTLTVKTRTGTVVLPMEEIVCVEHAGRIMRVHTTDGTVWESVYLRVSFESLVEPLCQQPGFLMSHKSFLVNLDHVRSMGINDFLMDNGVSVPISRRSLTEVRQKYLQRR